METSIATQTFGNICVAMATPFLADGSLDLESGARLAHHLVDSGCNGLIIHGTTGESPTTTAEEKDALLRKVIAEVGKKAKIVAGAGSNDTAHAVHVAQSAQASGADALLVVSPYYNRPSQEGLYQHVMAIVNATDLPVMLYDIPGRTGLAFCDDTLDRLAEHPRVLAVKDATGNVSAGFERINRTGMAYYSGDDGLNFSWLAHGGTGVVSVVGHLVAGDYAAMRAAIAQGDLAQAREINRKLGALVKAVMGGGQGAVMVKHALHLMGIIATPTVRLPLVNAPEAEVAALAEVLKSYKLL